MGLTLVTGRAHSGKEGRVRAHLVSGVRAGRETTLVVPGFADVRRARESLAGEVPVGIDVTTFEQWLDGLWRCEGDGRHVVSPALRDALARLACTSAGGSLGDLRMGQGFVDLISTVVARSAGLVRNAPSDPIMAEVADIASRYEELLAARGLIEPGHAAALAAQSGTITGRTVALSRFTDLSTTQLNLIRALSVSNDVLVSLTWAGGCAATEALTPVIAELTEIATTLEECRSDQSDTELAQLERALYSPGVPHRPRGSVVLAEAAGGEAEAALVAQAAIEAIRDGFAPERVAIVFRDLTRRRWVIEAALRASGVPFALDFQAEFGSSPLGSALLALARVASGRGGREDLLHYLRGPFSDAESTAVDDQDARWRRFRQEDPARLLADSEGLGEAVGRSIRLAKRLCNGPLTVDSLGNWQELSATLLSTGTGAEGRHESEVRLDVAAHGRLVKAAAEMVQSGLTVSGQEMLAGLSHSPVSSGSSERPGAIQVTEAHRVRSRRFDVVILGGLTAAEFSSEKREPLAATVLQEMGLSPGTDERLAERMLFYLVVTRARKRLVLVRQTADASGNAQRASIFWEEVRDLYRTASEAAAGECGGLGVSHRMTLGELENAAPALTPGRSADRARALEGLLKPSGLARGHLAHTRGLARGVDEFSVTEIERYLACPYSWFYERVIRPSEVDRAFDARSRGSYAHALLSGFYGRFRGSGRSRVLPELVGEALELLGAVASEMEGESAWKTSGLREEIAAATATAWVQAAIEQDAEIMEGFEPIEHEWAFGIEAGRPFSLAGVPLRGKVDRVELGTAGVIVTDYKSGSAISGHGSFASQGLVQVVAYSSAVAQSFDTKPVAGLYRSLSTGALRGYWNEDRCAADPCVPMSDRVDSEQIDELNSMVGQQITRAVEGMAAGHIEPRPTRAAACAHCGARPFCRAVGE